MRDSGSESNFFPAHSLSTQFEKGKCSSKAASSNMHTMSSSSTNILPATPTASIEPSVLTPHQQSLNEQKIQNLIGSALKILLNDERIFTGVMICVDNHANIILSNTTEYIPIVKESGVDAEKNGVDSWHKDERDTDIFNTTTTSMEQQQSDFGSQHKFHGDELPVELYDRRRLGLTVIPGKHIQRIWCKS
mmetsp:Transcript_4078/g.15345  ORF Transcript_4078/g.15345 Transcript_4078/m.15345 type:complete len:191 (-) Transcript_4078:226-798(-)